jgi:hypothetical protein
MYGTNGFPMTPITPSTANFLTTSMPGLVAKAMPPQNPSKTPGVHLRHCGFRKATAKSVSAA